MSRNFLKKYMNAKSGGLDLKKLKNSLDRTRKSTWEEGGGFKRKTSFAPSSLGFGNGTCPRYWYYAFRGVDFDSKATVEGIAAMDNGTDTHTRIQKTYLDTEGLNAIVEKELTLQDPPIRGFADVIVTIDGITAVGDIKTVKSQKYNYIVESMKPNTSHYLQVLIYMYIENLEHGYIHYENKDTHQEQLIPVVMTEKARAYLEETLAWMRKVYAYSTQEDSPLPKRPFTQTNIACKYCPLAKMCWSDEDGTVEIQPLKVISP